MTPLQRLTATLNGEPTDRIPVFCNLLDQGAQELGMSLEQYYAKGANVAEGQLRMQRKYGYDNVWSLFYVGKEAELLGCRKILFAEDGPPNVEHFVIQDYGDIERLEVPDDIAALPAFAETAECLRILRAEVGGKVPICAYLTASMTLPALLMGMDKWMELLLTGPVELRDLLLEKCSLFFRRQAAAYRAAGADVLLYSNPFGSTYFVGMKRFQALSLPWMEKDLLPDGVDDVVYYCGSAPFNNVIEQVRERLGIRVYYLGPEDDVAEGKRLVGGQGMACGVINDIKLLRWSTDEICAEVRRIVEAASRADAFCSARW
ncbi:uroporphyrinogen decarboxylase family protein [Methylogaea oryzae]|uniref:uroporphyrinogen decarboxylase family protein n=1 Tax=Methylogaea oryzae TaxID=1295382 RepID=UPI000B26DB39|nr:uroporphyrinogen decarboxylase family protein [Methylogaea oryzae]